MPSKHRYKSSRKLLSVDKDINIQRKISLSWRTELSCLNWIWDTFSLILVLSSDSHWATWVTAFHCQWKIKLLLSWINGLIFWNSKLLLSGKSQVYIKAVITRLLWRTNNAGKVEGNNRTQFYIIWIIILVMQTNCQGEMWKLLTLTSSW